jgi:hypothetical protein
MPCTLVANSGLGIALFEVARFCCSLKYKPPYVWTAVAFLDQDKCLDRVRCRNANLCAETVPVFKLFCCWQTLFWTQYSLQYYS